MLSYRPLHFCFLLTVFLSSPFLLSHQASGLENEGKDVVGFSRLYVYDAAPFENSPVPLAAERTRRKDPLNSFNKYIYGWNITDNHYWASVAYTAVPMFSIAAVWFLGFGLCLFTIGVCYFCRKREPYGYSPTCYALSLILLMLFTFTAVIGCAVLYIGQGSFHHSMSSTLQYVVHQADSTVDKLRNVSDYLNQAKQVGIDRIFLPTNVQTDIDAAETDINNSAGTLADKTKENSDNIQDLLDSARLALIIIAAVMLVLTFLGFLFSIFGIQLLVYILVMAGWVLVTGALILCGLFLVLHNATADSCVAVNEWIQYPIAHTAMDDILPCVDNATAQETILRSKEVTSELVNLVNQVITNASNINFAPNFTPLYYNQSGPLMPLLCNPFHPDMTDRQCDPGEVTLSNATQVYGSFVCQVSPSEICMTQGRLTPTFYNQVSAGINVANALYNDAPSLVELQDCTFVRETLSVISTDHCPGLRRYSRWIYVGLVMVSFAVMFSLIFWIVYGRERRHRLHRKELKNLTPTRAPPPGQALALAQIPEGDKYN
ncbi:uncharacterized protein LOC106759933 isoform X1 [Vigna radiata var. radiata]|uniref:Uncharacterized protein LOC106759933 isoform X1 n=2 Tax=Vigna radiata var. radiata TaxID=3916 RepID=A0A1S3TYH1_VIGRR|nr:uncharacterized protein LOC106759933 isoform X1 [Vigna radiata var. radiata]